MHRARLVKLIFPAVLMIILSSCGSKASSYSSLKTEHPDIYLADASFTICEGENNPIRLFADEIEVFSDLKKTTSKNTTFEQFDENSEIIVKGSCDNAEVFDNKKITLSGNTVLIKKEENAEIRCDELVWVQDTGSVRANGNTSITFSDQIFINADYISCNLNNSVYEIDDINDSWVKTDSGNDIKIACGHLIYDSENEVITSDTRVDIEDVEQEAFIKGLRLNYSKTSAIMELRLQTEFRKNTDKGLLVCTAESMIYDIDNQTLTIVGNAHVVWDKDSYRASKIVVDLESESIKLTGPITGEIYG